MTTVRKRRVGGAPRPAGWAKEEPARHPRAAPNTSPPRTVRRPQLKSRMPHPSGRLSPPTRTVVYPKLTAKVTSPIGARLFTANSDVIRAAQRQGSGKLFGHKKLAKSPRH